MKLVMRDGTQNQHSSSSATKTTSYLANPDLPSTFSVLDVYSKEYGIEIDFDDLWSHRRMKLGFM